MRSKNITLTRSITAVICVLHGVAFGLAMDLACAADVRICARDARFAVKEVDIGLAADIGTLARLPKAVGSLSWVKDVCLTARVFGAAEALAVGFVSQVHDDKAATVRAACATAALMAAKSPVAVQGTKELLNHARDHSVAESTSCLSLGVVMPLSLLVSSRLSLLVSSRLSLPSCRVPFSPLMSRVVPATMAPWLIIPPADLRYTRIWNSAALQSDDVRAALVAGATKTKPTFAKL